MKFAALCPTWLANYPKAHLGADLTAGIIVTLLVLPQSLAYALLAGLPPQLGLYASIFPVLTYAWLGSSQVQAVGPVAITAIMTFSVLSPIAPPGSPHYLLLAAALSLFSGCLLLLAGAFRLGFLSQLLSRPVINGFLSGSALLIALTQLRHLFGFTGSGSGLPEIFSALLHFAAQLGDSRNPTPLVGLGSFCALALGRRYLPPLLRKFSLAEQRLAWITRLLPLLVVFAATCLTAQFGLAQQGVQVIGHLENGLPGFQFFWPGRDDWSPLLLPALLMALIGMVQNISMAQALAIRRGERIDANQELRGLGAANIVAAFYGGMPVGGGVSRSAINVAAGAQTPLASVVSALTMIVLLMGAAHWFEQVPIAALAASIIVAVGSMIDVQALRSAWRYDRVDGLAYLGTALGVLFLGLERGIALGMLFSLASLLVRASSPHIAVIGRIPESEHFRNVERHGVETIPGALFLRIDESLFFGNLAAIENRLWQELEKAPATQDVVLIMSAVNRVDATAAEVLGDFNRDLGKRSIRFHLAEVKGPVQDRLQRTQVWDQLSGQVFLSVNDAFEHLLGQSRQKQA